MAGIGKAHMRPDGDRVLTVEDLTVEFRLSKVKIVKYLLFPLVVAH
jgi:hypothetical protein